MNNQTDTNTVPTGDDTPPIAEGKNITWSTKTPLFSDDVKGVKGFETLFIPTTSETRYRVLLGNTALLEKLGRTQDGREWISAVNNGSYTTTHADRFVKSAEDKNSDWRQEIEYEGDLIQMRSVNTSGGTGSVQLADIVTKRLGLGTPKWTPLPHSGFCVSILPATEGELLELHRLIVEERATLGRQTFGAIFSNVRSYFSAEVMRFIMRHIKESTLNVPVETLMSHIKLLDHDALVTAIAAATWPNGVKYSRACTVDPDKCTHVSTGKMFPQRMHQIDLTALTKRQCAQLARRTYNSVTVEDLKSYQKEFLRGQPRIISLGQDTGIGLQLRICTIQDYADSGYRWVSELEKAYTEALIADTQTRNDYLFDQAKATAMRQYAHFVEAILVDGEVRATCEKEQQEAIEETLGRLSCDDELRKAFTTEVGKFIDDSTIAIIGVNAYKCPSCGGVEKITDASPRWADVIPVDATKAFFTLLGQKAKIIKETR